MTLTEQTSLLVKEQELLSVGVSLRFLSKSFDDWSSQNDEQQYVFNLAREYAAQFNTNNQNGKNLIFSGKNGTGKTHLAISILKAVAAKEFAVLYINELAVAGITEDTSRDQLTKLVTPELLVIDHIGINNSADVARNIAEIVACRYEDCKSTILVTDLSIASLTLFLGNRVIDRMREGGGEFLVFDWPSMRGEIK